MSLIWLSHFIPYPPRGGAYQRSFHLLREAARNHEVMLVAFNRPAVNAETLTAYTAELRKFCAHVEFWELPFAWKGLRWWTTLLTNTVSKLPHSCEVYRSSSLLARWEGMLREHPDALLHIDSSDLAVFAQAAQGRRILLNHHNCESAMAFRRASVEPNRAKKVFLLSEARKHARLEHELCPAVTVNAVVSPEDSESLRAQAPSARIIVVGNGTDTAYFLPDPKATKDDTLVFTGMLNWYPNVSGLRFFREQIWPKVKQQVAGVKCIVAGMNPVQEIRMWAASDPSVTLVDSPADIRPSLASGAVYFCPIIDGGGTRLKLLDAMSAGKGIVTTRVGAEGLGVENRKQALVADSDDEFLQYTLELLSNRSLCTSLGQNAREFVERHYAWNVIGRSLDAAYGLLQTEPS